MSVRSAVLRLFCAGLIAALGAPPLLASTLTPLFAYPGNNDGDSPQGSLINAGGVLYGVAAGGGNWFSGTIFTLNRATGAEATVYSFTGKNDGAAPVGGLIEVGGILYGTTAAGGASGNGVLFRFDPVTGAETTLHSFAGGTQGAHPYATLLHVKGVLYGTTYGSSDGTGGSIFSYDLATGKETTLYTAVPFFAYSGVISVGALLYGTTEDAVFSFDPATRTYSAVYRFTGNLDGGDAFGGLLDLNGTLYGTTRNGGRSGCGVVYAINPATGAETTLYSFTGGQDGEWPLATLIAVGGNLYGTANNWGADYSGTIFRINPKTGAETTLYAINYQTDGFGPMGALVDVNGVLYATVSEQGPRNAGSVVAVDIATRAETTLHQFLGTVTHVNSALTNVAGQLYGVSSQGGPSDNGIILRINPANGAASTVYGFAGGKDGASPQGALTAYQGMLYGTTTAGGASSAGTVYRFNPATQMEAPLYAFTGGADGAFPAAQLSPVNGLLTGTTPYGGARNNGSIFQVNPATGAETTLFSFDSLNFESADLDFNSTLLVGGGYLYGMRHGLFYSTGLVYSVNIATGAGAVLHEFPSVAGDGYYPQDNLINVGGVFYGTTQQGGAAGSGTVFKLNRLTGADTVLTSFAGQTDGAFPAAALLSLNGLLYGTTGQGGTYGLGTLFSVNPATGARTTLYAFTGGADGANPASALIAVGGVLYGTTNYGAARNRGAAFSFTP